MSRNALIIIVLAVVFISVLVYSTFGLKQHRVEVCIAYQGRTACRTASGPTREQAIRTATDNACAFLASGMTESMACGSTQPVSVKWLK